MITTSPPSTPSINSTSQTQTSPGQTSVKTATGGSQTAVILVPCNATVAAMPLEEDISKPGSQVLKCKECNEMFQDDSSLAMHYQQSSESNSQVRVHNNLYSKGLFLIRLPKCVCENCSRNCGKKSLS